MDSNLPWPAIVQFLRTGVLLLPDLLSEQFRSPEFGPAFARAKERAQINFNVFTLGHFNCSDLISPQVRDSSEAGFAALRLCSSRPTKHKDMPYFQLLNLHEIEPFFADIALSLQLGSLASDLLQKPSVRLYQTGLFRKDATAPWHQRDMLNQVTSYHRDLNQWPLDTNHALTFWCPVTRVTMADSGLVYALESHLDVAHFYWWGGEEELRAETLRHRLVRYPTLNVGDCVVHHANLLHAALAQTKGVREAVTFSYVDAETRKLPRDEQRPKGNPIWEPDNTTEDMMSFNRWFNDVPYGGVLDHPLTPIVWPPPPDHPFRAQMQGIVDTADPFVEVPLNEAWTGPADAASATLQKLFSDEL